MKMQEANLHLQYVILTKASLLIVQREVFFFFFCSITCKNVVLQAALQGKAVGRMSSAAGSQHLLDKDVERELLETQ